MPVDDPLDGVPMSERVASPQRPNANKLPAAAGVRSRFTLTILILLFFISALLVLYGVLAILDSSESEKVATQDDLQQCASIASEGYEDIADSILLDDFIPANMYNTQDTRRAMRAIERADERLIEAWQCYADIDGGREGQLNIERARLALADWLLLYESADLDEFRTEWYGVKFALNITQ